MRYIEGFVAAVPADNKEAYRKHAAAAAPLFGEFGATRLVECWGDDVPEGKVNDFRSAVKAKEDEVVVFSWLEYPSKEARDAANQRIMSDPRMKDLGDMPFDGQRMIFAGFEPIVVQGGAPGGYVDGYLVPVPEDKRDAYRQVAEEAAAVFLDHGATRVVEAWGDDVPDGKVTDFKGAVLAEPGEKVVFSWVEWPSKEARAAGWEKVMADERLKREDRQMPFDGKRMIYGGFAPILDVAGNLATQPAQAVPA